MIISDIDTLKIIKRNQASSNEFTTVTLEEFTSHIPYLLRSECHNPNYSDVILEYFKKLNLGKAEWINYANFDPDRPYTRNLLVSDSQTFTLALMCWNPMKESVIHDHPCDGCWMRVCEGEVEEVRYVADAEADRLIESQKQRYKQGTIAFINDSIGYHKVGNPSPTKQAVSLHLYCPPFDSCKIWLDSDVNVSKPSARNVVYDDLWFDPSI